MRQNYTDHWLHRLQTGGTSAFCELFEDHRPRLRRMLEWRMDARLSSRLDASDVLQETFLDARRRLPDYLQDPRVPAYVWLRGLAYERLLRLHRHHLRARCRDVTRQVHLPAETSAFLARQIMSARSTPSRALTRNETHEQVQEAVSNLKDEDREIILMRHFEGMSNAEVAHVLNLSDSGASMRYGRALFRLRQLLSVEQTNGES